MTYFLIGEPEALFDIRYSFLKTLESLNPRQPFRSGRGPLNPLKSWSSKVLLDDPRWSSLQCEFKADLDLPIHIEQGPPW